MAFGDLNNDKYTDIITIGDSKTAFTVHMFEPLKKMFLYQKTFKMNDGCKISNIAIGRSVDRIRLFVTCAQVTGATVVKIYDKVGKYLDFMELGGGKHLQIEAGSQPFIADLNGDFLEDILFTDTNRTLMVAFQNRNPEEFTLREFDSSMLFKDESEGCMRKIPNSRMKLSIPHSSALVDFDGDCLSDLFLTVTDQTTGKSYYEIFLRRELQNDDSEEQVETISVMKGLNAFCLATREEIPSQSNNLFHFADMDKDGMIDMLFVTKNDLSLHVYYNKLSNQQQR